MDRGYVFLRIVGLCMLLNQASSISQLPVPVTTTDQIDQGLRNGITSLCANWCTRQDIEDMCRSLESQSICDERLPRIVDEYFCSPGSCPSGNSCFAPMSFTHATSQPHGRCILTDIVDAAEAYGAGNYVEYRRALAVASFCKDWCSYALVMEPPGTLDDALSWYFCERVDPDCGWNRCKLDISSVAAAQWEGMSASQCIRTTTGQSVRPMVLESTTSPRPSLTPTTPEQNTTGAPQKEDVTVKAAAGAVAALAVIVAVGIVAAVYCRRKKMRVEADQQLRITIVEPPLPPRPKIEDGIPPEYRVFGQIDKKEKSSKKNKFKPWAKPYSYVHMPNKGNQHGPPANPRPPVPHDNKKMRPPLKKIESAPRKPTPGQKIKTRKEGPRPASDPAKKRVDVDIEDTETIYLDALQAYTPLDSVATHVRGPKLPPR